METLLGKHWHHLPAGEALDLLGANPDKGLDAFEVERRAKHFGPNVLTPTKPKPAVVRFLLQFHNSLVCILLAASAVTGILKDWTDALVILGVVLINAVIGYFQEAKAERAIHALAETMSAGVTVVRSGKTRRITAAEQHSSTSKPSTSSQANIAMPTPAAAMSLMMPIFSLCRVSTKSHSASMALFMTSATRTSAVTTTMSRESTQARANRAATRTHSEKTSFQATLRS